MAVKVFISATSYDMEECRPAAYKAIQEYGSGVAVTMENWNSEYRPAPEVCHDKLKQESSHYVGIYGYRYGWIPGADGALIPACDHIPDAVKKSITEIEYYWARHYQKPMAVLIPKRGSKIDLDLKRRADLPNPQAEDAAVAQKAFHRVVKNEGTIMPFSDVVELALQINKVVNKWQDDGLRGIAREAEPGGGGLRLQQEILQLGREDQVRQFEDWVDEVDASDLVRAACFIVHADNAELGTEQAVQRLAMQYDEISGADIKRITFNVDVLWQGQGLENMLCVIGNQIENGWEPANLTELTARLAVLLGSSDVLLTILDAQRFQGGLTAFRNQFWLPLVQSLPNDLANQLLVLVEHENIIDENCADFYCGKDALDDFDDAYKPEHLILLPELKAFTEKEIRSWLRKRPGFDGQKAKLQAAALFGETNGKPQSLYIKLQDLS